MAENAGNERYDKPEGSLESEAPRRMKGARPRQAPRRMKDARPSCGIWAGLRK